MLIYEKIVEERLNEFKARLHRTVEKATCDLIAPDKMTAYVETLCTENVTVTVANLKDLVAVLNGELHQLRTAVLEQK